MRFPSTTWCLTIQSWRSMQVVYSSCLTVLILHAFVDVAYCETHDVQVNDIVFTAANDSTEQRYVLMLPAAFDASQSRDLLIALHGHGADRWQFIRDMRDECRAARDVAAAHNMLLVAPDYRARTSWMGPQAEADVVQIIDDLKKKYRVSRVFLCGGSMGGTASLTFAALHPDTIDGVAAMNATANLIEYSGFNDVISASFGGSKNAVPDEYKKRSAEFWPKHFTMPVAVTCGGKDDVIPPQSVLRFADALKALGRDVLMIHRAETGHSTNYTDARTAIEFVIQKAKPADDRLAPTVAISPLAEWRFGRDGDFQGWQSNGDLADVRVVGGAWHGRGIGSDPILEFKPHLDIPAAPWDVIEMRLKADHDGSAEIFWSGTDQGVHGGFSQEKTTRFDVIGDNAWHTYRVRPFWHAERRIVRLRFDLYDAASFELDSFRVIKSAGNPVQVEPVFDFSQGMGSWRAVDGAALASTVEGLAMTTRESNGLIVAPPLNFDAREHHIVSLQMAVDRGRYATIRFATADRTGLHSKSFPVHADGRDHTYNLDMTDSPNWQGKIISLALRPTDEVGTSARLKWLRASLMPQGDPAVDIRTLGIEEFPVRAGRPVTIAARVINEGGAAITNLTATLKLPEGIRALSNIHDVQAALPPGGETIFRWSVAAEKPLTCQATMSLRADNAPSVATTTSLNFTAIPRSATPGYVPTPQPVRGPFEVGVYYFPGWANAKQWQPIRPFPERRPVLSWYREGDPEIADWHIKWAVEHGITFFVYDWYWDRGQRQLEHALHDGYFKARYRSLLKFCLLWANHNPPNTSSRDDCLAVTRYWIANYFRQPEHMQIDGKPMVVIFAPENLTHDLGADQVRSVFDAMRTECVHAGLKGLYLIARVNSVAEARAASAQGYDAVTSYTWPHLGAPPGEFRAPFAALLASYRNQWQQILDSGNIAMIPPLCGGWDSRPWHGESNYIRFDRTPELFRQHVRDARQFLESTSANPRLRNMLIVEAWNEWGEGAYIEPHTEFGFGYLDAMRTALTSAPEPHEDIAPVDVGHGPYDAATPTSPQ